MAADSRTDLLRSTVVQIFNRLLSGEISGGEALVLWPPEEEYYGHPILREAYHTLLHYQADEDIRNIDPAYCQDQREELRALVERLLPLFKGERSQKTHSPG